MDLFTVKAVYNAACVMFAATMSYLGLDTEAMTILGILILIDTFTGVLKVRIVNPGTLVTSKKGAWGIGAKLLLFLIPATIALVVKAQGVDASGFLFSCVNLIILSEAYSIIGNIHSIRSGEDLPEIDAVSMIAKRIRDVMLALANKGKGGK